jgi:hypothetical protein
VNDRDFCNRTAALAAEAIRDKFAYLHRGANDYSAFGPGIVLFFGNEDATAPEGNHPVVAQLRAYLAIEEVGIHELGFGTTKDQRTWALLAESRRDLEYCCRLIWKAFRAVEQPRVSRQEA